MIYLPVFRYSVKIHPGVEENLHKRNNLGKNQPNINHFNIGSWGEALGDTDEEGGEDKEGGEVDSHHSFKKEVFEEIGGINNDEDKECRKIYSKNSIVNPSL